MNVPIEKSLLQVMYERKSVRKYNPSRKIDQTTLHEIITAAVSAPSSWNLQPWKFLIVTSDEQKKKLLDIAGGQSQVVESSAVVIVLGDKEGYKNGEYIFSKEVGRGYKTIKLKEVYMKNLPIIYTNQSSRYGSNFAHEDAIRNGSLVAMQLMLAAKSLGVDSCPMIGFDKNQLVEQFNIPERYIPVLMITLGYGLGEPHKTIRLPIEDFIIKDVFEEMEDKDLDDTNES